MSFLVDTHVFLWIVAHKQLTAQVTALFFDTENTLYFSAASYWEICIKIGTGKLGVVADWREVFADVMNKNQMHWLAVEKRHCEQVANLPKIHGDPFDRMLIAQALVEDLTLMTADAKIQQYSVPTLW